ncbi:hypothetical protein COOONC_26685, partial [Cooperia oncophora]
MVPIFNTCSKICIDVIEEYALDGRPVPIKDVITRLTLDMTAKCAFGYDFDVQHNRRSSFVEFARKFCDINLSSRKVALYCFPTFAPSFQRITGISILSHEANEFFFNVLNKLFHERKNGNHLNYNDFFDILLNNFVEDSKGRGKDEEISNFGTTSKGLSKGDILGQAFMFVLAGFETTPAALHLTIYMLAVHYDFQKRCRDEVERICGEEGDITYAMLSEMK